MEMLLNSLKSDLAVGRGLKDAGRPTPLKRPRASSRAVMARTAPAPGGRSKEAPEILGKGISLGESGIFCC